MVEGVILTMLTVETVSDIKSKSISVVRQMIFIVTGLVINSILGYQSVVSILGGVMVGLMLFAYAFLTREGIGYGDCLVFVGMGIYIGFIDNMRLLFGSILVGAFVGVIYALFSHKNMDTRIPFVPCILGTYIMMMAFRLMGGTII